MATVVETAQSERNLVPDLRVALETGCTIGEVCNELRAQWGTWDNRAS
ncbi:MAG: hypothetical protein H7123_08030 [Thermoleophilia bacterium]|nr:hypothetical protein [Thermoleophilia bacterium]